MLLALAPFVPFNWGNASRYLYQPAIGFSMLVAEAVVQLDRVLGERTSARLRVVFVTLVITAVSVRFALFATGNIEGFAERTEAYRRYASTLKEVHGELPSHTIVRPDPRLEAKVTVQICRGARAMGVPGSHDSTDAVRVTALALAAASSSVRR